MRVDRYPLELSSNTDIFFSEINSGSQMDRNLHMVARLFSSQEPPQEQGLPKNAIITKLRSGIKKETKQIQTEFRGINPCLEAYR